MEKTLENNTNEEPKEPKKQKASITITSTAKRTCDVFKAEKAKLLEWLNELFANECYKYWRFSYYKNKLEHFFDNEEKKTIEELGDKYVEDWVPVLRDFFRNSYKYWNWKLHKLKLNLEEIDVRKIINDFVIDICERREKRIADGEWKSYVRKKWLLSREKKWDKYAKHELDAQELGEFFEEENPREPTPFDPSILEEF